MSEDSTAGRKVKARSGDERPGLFARIALFVRQVVLELKKVIWPTRTELIRYTIVALVFIVVTVAFLGVVDIYFLKLVLKVFG